MQQEQVTALVDELFDSWYPHLVRYAARLTGQRASAEEIVQDTFLDLYKALRAGQTVRQPKAWTMAVVRHKASDCRRQPWLEPLDGDHDVTADWSDDVHTAIDCQRVRTHLCLLSVREEEVLMLRLQSLKYREIAESLGISINSVNTLLARALEKMQNAFASDRARSVRRAADV
jgi:RNA polymerase sigma-70 factor (ECF subfamily)